MAGISGWIDWDGDLRSQAETLARMARAVSHRGPDGEGTWTSRRAALAHRRTARIESEQPLVRPGASEGACVLVFDGALDNADELRRALGPSASNEQDAELILRGYLAWGPDVVEKLGGSFAIAIWDESKSELFLARDRLGLKPLYYAIENKRLLFGSEPKALFAHPSMRPEIDDAGLAELFVLSFVKTPGRAVYRGMHELPPAHRLVFGEKGARLDRYWQIESRAHADDVDTTAAKIRSMLDDSVRRRLGSEPGVSTLLSGGLDSSGVTALAARALTTQKRGPVDAYAVEMRGASEWFVPTDIQPELDSVWAQKMADHLGASYRVLTLDADDVLKEFFAPLAARDLPSMGEMDVSLFLLCRQIKEKHDVVLSGESADELFGGYPFFFDDKACSADTFPWLVQTIAYKPADLLRPELQKRIRPDDYLRDRYREALSEVPRLSGESPDAARMREIFYLVRSRFLPILIDRKDRMSMASGLQARMPFADHRLHEYVWNVPWEMKCYRDREKGILRRALEGILPDDVLWRKKSGYPSMHDPVFTRAVQSRLSSRLDDSASPISSIIDVGKVRKMLDESAANPSAGGIGGQSHLFAYLIQLDEWLSRYRVRIV